jgi:hypothetical protein
MIRHVDEATERDEPTAQGLGRTVLRGISSVVVIVVAGAAFAAKPAKVMDRSAPVNITSLMYTSQK